MLFCSKRFLHSKGPKNAICLWLRLRKIDQSHAALFIFTTFSWSQPKTNCIFRTFRVKESFWTKKQSWILSKVDIKKWRPFFVFVCLNGCHFLKYKKGLKVLKMQFVFGWDYENLVKMNNAARLWSIFLSLSQRQISFLRPLEWRNLFGQKSKVVQL